MPLSPAHPALATVFTMHTMKTRVAGAWAILLATLALVAGCNTSPCDVDLADCDTEGCAVLFGERLEDEGCLRRLPAGCVSRDANAGAEATAARKVSDGSCWRFRSTLLAEGFTAASDSDSCAAQVHAAPLCQ